jgi:uncharacterized RDD family membrane protein YckC
MRIAFLAIAFAVTVFPAFASVAMHPAPLPPLGASFAGIATGVAFLTRRRLRK